MADLVPMSSQESDGIVDLGSLSTLSGAVSDMQEQGRENHDASNTNHQPGGNGLSGDVESLPTTLGGERDVNQSSSISIDIERGEQRRFEVSSTTDTNDGEGIDNQEPEEDRLSTKPTWEESSNDDTSDEELSITSTSPNTSEQTQKSVTYEPAFVNDEQPTKPPESSLKIDTCMAPEDDAPKEVGRNCVLSPAESTLATEPSTPNSTVTVEHRHVSKKENRSAGMLMGMRKPVVALLGLYLVGITGASAFLAQQYLTIPGLNQQIEELGQEVDRLEEQVDRLEKENDRFEQLNDELEANNEEYSRQNDRLEASNAYYAELNGQLNASNAELERLNGVLNASNVEYGRLNGELTKTTQKLNEQVDILEVVNSNLTDTLLEYILLSEGLSNETDRLDRLNDDLSENLFNLNDTLSDLRGENNRLHYLLDDLTTVTSFLNETANELERSYEEIANFLAEQIVANRVILSETLHNTYRQQTFNWVCGLSLRFAAEPFGSDGTLPIGPAAYSRVMDYVDKNVLSDLCLDARDFELFLATRLDAGSAPQTSATTNDVITAVMTYSSDAMDYYFPDAGETGGLVEADWADAFFRCENLPQEKRFLFYKAL